MLKALKWVSHWKKSNSWSKLIFTMGEKWISNEYRMNLLYSWLHKIMWKSQKRHSSMMALLLKLYIVTTLFKTSLLLLLCYPPTPRIGHVWTFSRTNDLAYFKESVKYTATTWQGADILIQHPEKIQGLSWSWAEGLLD